MTQPRIIVDGFDGHAASRVLAAGEMLTMCLAALLGDREHGEVFLSHEKIGNAVGVTVQVLDLDDEGGVLVRRVKSADPTEPVTS